MTIEVGLWIEGEEETKTESEESKSTSKLDSFNVGVPVVKNTRLSIKSNTSATEIIKQASFGRQSSIIKMDALDEEDEPGSPTNLSLSTLTHIAVARGTERRNDTTYRKRPL